MSFNGQGAPISIVKVEPRVTTKINDLGEEVAIPQFVLYVKKTQKGEVINSDKLKEICGNGEITSDDYGKVYISGMLGNKKLKCVPGTYDNPLIISQDRGEEFEGYPVRCQLDGEIDKTKSAYTSILNIELNYGFRVSAKREVTVLHS